MTEYEEPLIPQHVQSSGVLRTHLLPLVGYFLLTVLYTWPTVPHFFSHIPGTGDASWFLWQFWWFKHALLDLRQSPYITNVIYYPLQDVPVMAQTPVNELFSLPLQVAFNVVILNNLLFVFTYLLSGYFTYLLGLALTRRREPGICRWGALCLLCRTRHPQPGPHEPPHYPMDALVPALVLQCQRRPSWQRGWRLALQQRWWRFPRPIRSLFSPCRLGRVNLVCAYFVFWQRESIWSKKLWQAAFVRLALPRWWYRLIGTTYNFGTGKLQIINALRILIVPPIPLTCFRGGYHLACTAGARLLGLSMPALPHRI